jgi:gamma-glutamyltranspeptidase/glutathione hydrolase
VINNFACYGVLVLTIFLSACDAPPPASAGADRGMVAAAHPLAAQVGVDILKQGGNAIDAAIAVHFTLAVVYQAAGNLAGGGFAVFRFADGRVGSLDFRECAPLAATRDMYLDRSGQASKYLSRQGGLAVGVPGSVAGMQALHNKYGALPWPELIEPARRLAARGWLLTQQEADFYNRYRNDFARWNKRPMPFLPAQRWQAGDTLRQPFLAKTLAHIREKGADGFYQGAVAKYFLATVRQHEGIISAADLQTYEPRWREPLQGNYRDYQVITMAPPASGGVALLQLLQGSEDIAWQAMGHNSAAAIHRQSEMMRRVYADRAQYLGDPDFFPVPLEELLASEYNRNRYADILPHQATPSAQILAGYVERIESVETTHFSIVDHQRNAVAITTTLNSLFGNKIWVDSAGFFLNNEMDDFSVKPGFPNQFGLIGGEANAIAPRKRMLSSMTPTILTRNGRLFMVLGSPGGSTIITTVYQTIVNVIDFQMPMQAACDAGKIHHQWQPDRILYQDGTIPLWTRLRLEALGHNLSGRARLGHVNAILQLADGQLQGGHGRGRFATVQGY